MFLVTKSFINLEFIVYHFTIGTRDGRVVLWCLESYSIIQELPAHKRQVNGVRFSSDAKRVVSCGSDFYMKVIDLQTGTILFSKGKQTAAENVHKIILQCTSRFGNSGPTWQQSHHVVKTFTENSQSFGFQ